jgi:Domain of unknown function (DUF4333)
MQFQDDLNPNIGRPVRPAASSPWLVRSLVVGFLVACAVVAASLAIGSGGSSAAPTILNTEKVERAIEQSSLTQRGVHAVASCPAGVRQQKGLKFSCTAVVKGIGTTFAVTELDGSGHVHYEAR